MQLGKALICSYYWRELTTTSNDYMIFLCGFLLVLCPVCGGDFCTTSGLSVAGDSFKVG